MKNLKKEMIRLDEKNTMEGYDVNETMVVLENAEGKFILGHKYENSISIGSGFVKEYETLEEALEEIAKGTDIKDMDEAYNEKDIIRSIRKKTGLTQKAFGKKYGIPERTIQDWETGQRKPTSYVMEMLNKTIEDEKLTPMTYVFEHYRDKAGYGHVEYFTTEKEAIEHAKKEWNHLNDADKKSFTTDPAGRFDVTLRKMRWDDDEWICEYDSEKDIWDALED